mgnify:CR=1 FL=1
MPDESFKNRSILVVDDEERMVRFIRLNLEHDGFRQLARLSGLSPSFHGSIRRSENEGAVRTGHQASYERAGWHGAETGADPANRLG